MRVIKYRFLFEGLPSVEVLELALKALGHPKLAVIDHCIHQAVPNKTLRQDVSIGPLHICDDTFTSGKHINDEELAKFWHAGLIDLLPLLDDKES